MVGEYLFLNASLGLTSPEIDSCLARKQHQIDEIFYLESCLVILNVRYLIEFHFWW